MENVRLDLKQDYLHSAPNLRAFYGHPFFPSANYEAVAKARDQFPIDREGLVAELIRQNQGLENADATLANIQALGDPKTYTVTTGHQLCWMGGPMFTIHKILSTIKLARQIEAKSHGLKVVPVFWMASEDHDWEEVNHYFPEAGKKVTYAAKHKGPVGRHILEASATEAFAETTPAELKAFFQPGTTLAAAFRSFIHHLFGRYGLVIVDGDSPILKRMFLPSMLMELKDQTLGKQAQAQTRLLEEAGYTAPAKPRDVNLFYLGHGGRSGIVLQEGKLNIPDAGISWSSDEAAVYASAFPENFSPNVVTRPIYQEAILPNLAYIGGWAEMGYWMQLKTAFDAANTAFPLLVPRMSGSIVTTEMLREAQSLGFSLADFQKSLNDLQETYLLKSWDPSELQQAIEAILLGYEKLAKVLDKVDPTLGTSMRGERGRTAGNMENLEKKTKKQLRNRDPKPYLRIAALKNLLNPEQEKQERMLNFTAFPIEYPRLIEALLAQCNPEVPQEEWIQLP